MQNQTSLDWQFWLPMVANQYQISPNTEDYILSPVPAIPVGIPNINGVAFSLSELCRYHREYNHLSYKSWITCPVHIEHDHLDDKKAIGVIVDVTLKKSEIYDNQWFLYFLLALDKQFDTTRSVMNNEINSYSMGARIIEDYQCSITGRSISDSPYFDSDEPGAMRVVDGKLLFAKAIGIIGFECSVVADPAWRSAITDVRHVII
jgi:hypothetical protein